jgi:hypothetical protein
VANRMGHHAVWLVVESLFEAIACTADTVSEVDPRNWTVG